MKVPRTILRRQLRLTLAGFHHRSRRRNAELLRRHLRWQNFEWAFWAEDKDQFKLIRTSIPADGTEVVRD